MTFLRTPHPSGRRLVATAVLTALLAGTATDALAETKTPNSAETAVEHRYVLHPVTGVFYTVRDERGTKAEPVGQWLLRVAPRGDQLRAEAFDLVPLVRTALAEPAEFFAVGPDDALYTVHSVGSEEWLAVYRETAPEPEAGSADARSRYEVRTHRLPTESAVVAMRATVDGVFLATEDAAVYRVDGGEVDDDGEERVRFVRVPGTAPEREAPRPVEKEPDGADRSTPGQDGDRMAETEGEGEAGGHPDEGPADAENGADPGPPAERGGATGPAEPAVEGAEDPSPLPAGALVMSVEDTAVSLSRSAVDGTGLRRSSTGALNSAMVLDSRTAEAGWSLVGQAGDFHGSGSVIAAQLLGWTPSVQILEPRPDGAAAPRVRPGPRVAPGEGLAVPRTLCAGEPGASSGVFRCGAGLELGIPARAAPGGYAGTLTLTLS